MSRLLTDVVGALSEAWQELRIHRTRVLLSLIGVAVAVCAITTVVGVAGIAEQAMTENSERYGGRSATLKLSVYSESGAVPDAEKLEEAWNESVERFGIEYAGRVGFGQTIAQFADGSAFLPLTVVDQSYGVMHRLQLDEGTWFADGDEERLAPALVVNEAFWQRLGSPNLTSNPTVTLRGEAATTAVIIGVSRSESWDTEPSAFMLHAGYAAVTLPDAQEMALERELWVPPELSEQISNGLKSEVEGRFGPGFVADVMRSDPAAFDDDPMLPLKIMVGGVAGLVLLLGALGLVNIAMVTVKQRIREIGIRRSFGATAGRVFFAVMMESVVATVVAGAVGVMVAILIVKSPFVEDAVGQGMIDDFPPFPVEAALLGLLCATVVGALAGLMPALVAVRVKVIDAIRY